MIELKNITKIYHSKKNNVIALNDVSFTLDNKGITFILGKSGSGKSTLLNLLGGLDKPSTGKIIVDGKCIKDFSNKDYEAYRNTYIGFVFQDFNLIEDYNVYDNIVLALKLQKKKINTNSVNKLLKDLELLELKDRKVNELSGGQKQRVAIARALIKNPKIILADEPTGNLDSKTGSQVFNLLKKISKDRLVIIVSHDNEAAKEYGDNIIKIKDGKIIDNSKITTTIQPQKKNLKLISAMLPLKDSCILCFKSLKHKKIKIMISSILLSIALALFGVVLSLITYQESTSKAKLIQKEHINMLAIKKCQFDYDYQCFPLFLNKEEISNIKKQLNQQPYPIYASSQKRKSALEYGFINYFGIQQQISLNSKTNAYTINHDIEFVEMNDFTNFKEEIIGNFPKENNEILISNYIADQMIMYGVKANGSNGEQIYNPKNYNDLLNLNLSFDFLKLKNIKISGIINYDLTEFENLKTSTNIDNSYVKLDTLIENIYTKIFVTKEFINFYNNTDGNQLIEDYSYELKSENIRIRGNDYYIRYGYANEQVEYYNGNMWTTEPISNKQILLNIRQLVNFNEQDYQTRLKAYLDQYPTENQLELEKNFFAEYASNMFKNIIGQTITLNIYDYNNTLYAKLKNIEIVGFIGLYTRDETKNLFSKDIIKDYIATPLMPSGILVYENNFSEVEKLFTLFPADHKYFLQTIYSYEMILASRTITKIKNQCLWIGIGFLLFAIFLLFNLIITTIDNQKKKIGILRAIGAKKIDIVKIFIIENVIITFISTLLSFFFLVYATNYLNAIIIQGNGLLEPFIFHFYNFIIIFILALFITLLIVIVSIYKLSKMNPIDTIYKH